MNKRTRDQRKKDNRKSAQQRAKQVAGPRYGTLATGFRSLAADAADVVITQDDPYAQLKSAPPGVYQILDTVRGAVEMVDVHADHTHTVTSSKPLDVPDMTDLGRVKAFSVGGDSPWEAQHFELGQRYAGPIPTSDGTQIEVTPMGIKFVEFMDGPEQHEIKGVREGRIAMRMLTSPHCIFFLLKCGDRPWCEAPYSVHRVTAAGREHPGAPEPGYGWMLHIILVDSRTGIVRGLRQLALSNAFCHAIVREYEKQRALPADDAAHQAECRMLMARSTEDLAAMATDRFQQGRDAS